MIVSQQVEKLIKFSDLKKHVVLNLLLSVVICGVTAGILKICKSESVFCLQIQISYDLQ